MAGGAGWSAVRTSWRARAGAERWGGGGVSSSVEGSYGRGGENNAKGYEGWALTAT